LYAVATDAKERKSVSGANMICEVSVVREINAELERKIRQIEGI
jgi:hypothetical protein